MERFVRRRLELGEIVAQVGYFIHRIFTFKGREKKQNRWELNNNPSSEARQPVRSGKSEKKLTENVLYRAGIDVGADINEHVTSGVH